MNITLTNDLINDIKTVKVDSKKIADSFLKEYEYDRPQVIEDLSFDGYYKETLFSYMEDAMDNIVGEDYSYDYEDFLKLVEEVTNYIIY